MVGNGKLYKLQSEVLLDESEEDSDEESKSVSQSNNEIEPTNGEPTRSGLLGKVIISNKRKTNMEKKEWIKQFSTWKPHVKDKMRNMK